MGRVIKQNKKSFCARVVFTLDKGLLMGDPNYILTPITFQLHSNYIPITFNKERKYVKT